MCDIKFERRNILQWFWSMSSSSIRLEASIKTCLLLVIRTSWSAVNEANQRKVWHEINNQRYSLCLTRNFGELFHARKIVTTAAWSFFLLFFSLFSSLPFISISLNTEKSFFLFFSCHLFIQIHIFFYYFFFSSLFTKDVFGKKALVSLSLSLFPHLKYDICTKVLLLFSFFAFPS